MDTTQWFYSDFNRLLQSKLFCEQAEFGDALVYLLTFQIHTNLRVTPHKFSIEISNNCIHIFVIHTVDNQQKEYPKAKELKNVHFVSCAKDLAEMNDFSEMKNEIKFISKGMLMTTVAALTENSLARSMQSFIETDSI